MKGSTIHNLFGGEWSATEGLTWGRGRGGGGEGGRGGGGGGEGREHTYDDVIKEGFPPPTHLITPLRDSLCGAEEQPYAGQLGHRDVALLHDDVIHRLQDLLLHLNTPVRHVL